MDAKGRIQQLMDARGWTRYRLAKEAGLSHSTITNMFNKNNAPTIPTLELICATLGITMSQFFLDDEEAIDVTEQQKELLGKWNALRTEQREALLHLMDTMV